MNSRTVMTRCLLVVLVLWASVTMAQVAPTSIFQLNGNAADSGQNTCTYGGVSGQHCDYWNLLNGLGNNSATGGVGTNSSPGSSLVRTFINGTASTDSFIGGGSKDPNPLSSWAYSNHSTPDKDTLNAGYAAAYQQGGDFEIIFGADRFSPNGDANIGIWFFQNTVGTNGSGGFTGSHMEHDILVISSFTNGGGTSGIAVYEWEPACNKSHYPTPTKAGDCSDTNIAFLASTSAGTACTSSSAYCAITNSGPTTSTWEGSIASPLFFEGGVDITYALSQVGITNLPCFSSFLIDTRSSQSTSAVLKDFLLGGFPVCGLHITKSCGTASVDASGNFFNYPVSGTVTNTGIGTLYLATVTDVITHSDNSTVTVHPTVTPATLAPGASGTWSTTVQDTGLQVADSATASANTASDGSGTTVNSDNTAQATCSTALTTTLSVTKNCTTSLVASGGNVHVNVAFNGSVCNNGSASISNITLVDFQSTSGTSVPVASNLSLGPATGNCSTSGGVTTCSVPTCTTYSGNYNPTSIDTTVNGGNGPGRYFFNDLVAITGATSAVGQLQTLTGQTETRCNNTFGCAPASCPICQGTGECTP